MMNSVWGIMLLFGLVAGLINGQGGMLLDSMMTGCGEAVTLCISLCGAYMVWMGFMEVAKDMGVIDRLARLIYPVMKKIFPHARNAVAPITLNLAANFFGMGSAATPFGLSAMEEMQKHNKTPHTATNDMCMFIALNASALELLPTTVLALRAAAMSTDTYCVVFPTAIASIAAFIAAIVLCKIFEVGDKRKCS